MKTPSNYPHITAYCPQKMQVRGAKMKEKEKELELNSLGSSEALTQFLHQRFSLPLFGDIREQLSVKSIKKTHVSITLKKRKGDHTVLESFKSQSQESCRVLFRMYSLTVYRISNWQKTGEKETNPPPPPTCNSLHDGIEVLCGHTSLWI